MEMGFLNGLGEHWRQLGKIRRVPKKGFDSKAEADYFIDDVIKDKTAKSYLCSVCGKWHIGH